MERTLNWEHLRTNVAIEYGLEKPVQIHYGNDGKTDDVLVNVIDGSFILNLHDEKEEMKWEDACEHKAFSKQQALLIVYYFDEIQKCLKDAGGDPLRTDTYYWTCTEFHQSYAWFVHFGNGGFFSNLTGKYYAYVVRGVAASK